MASTDDTLDEILAQVRRLLDVNGCAFLMIDWRERSVRPAASWFASDEVRAALTPVLARRLDPERPGLTEAAIEKDGPVLVRDIASWPAGERLRRRLLETLTPEAAELTWRWYRSSTMISCPVRTASGRQLGVLAIAATAPGPEDIRAVEVFANLAALAIERTELLDHERRIAQALARGFVPPGQERLDGLEIGVVYEPAGHAVGGGDVFGAWPLPGGAIGLMIGDVSGKGLEVAAKSAMARFFMEACSQGRSSPAAVLEEVNALLCRRGVDAFIPAVLAVVADGRLRWANAGHLPPLLVGPDAAVLRPLEGTGMPLAVEPDARWEDREVAFSTGDVLVAVTDGVVEARHDEEGLERFGEERLEALVRAHARTRSAHPQRIAEAMYADVSAWAAHIADDIVVLVARGR